MLLVVLARAAEVPVVLARPADLLVVLARATEVPVVPPERVVVPRERLLAD